MKQRWNLRGRTAPGIAGDRLYLVTREELHVVDRSGTTLARVRLPSTPTSTAASALGFFMTDAADRLWSLATGESELANIAACAGCQLRGADTTRVYVTTLAPRDARHPVHRDYDAFVAYTDLLAYEVSAAGAALVGRHHIPPLYDNLLIGPGRVVALAGTIVTLQPAPP